MSETTATKEWIAGTRALSRRILAILIDHDKPDQAREALAYVCSELLATGEDLEDVLTGIDELDEDDSDEADEADELADASDEAETTDPAMSAEELRDMLGDEATRGLLADRSVRFPRPETRILPFPPTSFLPGERKRITVQPSIGVQPRRLLIPSGIAPLFVIHDVELGTESQFAPFGAPISAVVFSELAAGVNLPIPEMKQNDLLTIDVERLPEAPITFSCLVDCDAPKGPANVPNVS